MTVVFEIRGVSQMSGKDEKAGAAAAGAVAAPAAGAAGAAAPSVPVVGLASLPVEPPRVFASQYKSSASKIAQEKDAEDAQQIKFGPGNNSKPSHVMEGL